MFSTPMTAAPSDSSSYPQFYSQSSSSASSSSDHSPRSSSHLFEYYQAQQQFSSLSSSRPQTGSMTETTLSSNRCSNLLAATGWRTSASLRPSPRLSQTYPRVPFFAGYQSTRSFLSVTAVPVFTAPFHSSRERFQVNSMGRPIVRPQNHHHHQSQMRGYPIRRWNLSVIKIVLFRQWSLPVNLPFTCVMLIDDIFSFLFCLLFEIFFVWDNRSM